MEGNKYRISMVGYLNTQPFKWALEEIVKEGHELILETPADCARSLSRDEVDLALIPVGAFTDFRDYALHTDYCIGCDGEVRTVVVLSDQPISELDTIYLDDHSRTSQLLTQIVVSSFLDLKCQFVPSDVSNDFQLPSNAGVLMIGDKVFKNEDRFTYRYDLGEAWKTHTGLPFVFAVWVSKPETCISEEFIRRINQEMKGVFDNLEFYLQERPAYSNGILLDRYYRKNISYRFDKSKKMALQFFLQKVKELKISNDYLFSSR